MFKPREFINVEIKRKDWCGYKGECLVDDVMCGDLCSLCSYRISLPIPQILREAKEKKERDKQKLLFSYQPSHRPLDEEKYD